MGETKFNQIFRSKYQLVIAAGNFAREKNLSQVLIPKTSKDIDEQLKLAHKVVHVKDWANRMFCVPLLRYSVDNLESCDAQVRLFASKKYSH